jgi:hypothetical protein
MCLDVVALLRENPGKIEIYRLLQNQGLDAIDIFIERTGFSPDSAHMNMVVAMLRTYPAYLPIIVSRLRASPENIDWNVLSENPHPEAIKLLRENPDKINQWGLSRNPCADAVAILREDLHGIAWHILSANPCPDAVALLRENFDKVHWVKLSKNPCPDAVALLRENPDKIDWKELATNWCPGAVSLFSDTTVAEQNISWEKLSGNPGIFEEVYDYDAMRAVMDIHRESLAKVAFHPRRLARHLEFGGDPDDF